MEQAQTGKAKVKLNKKGDGRGSNTSGLRPWKKGQSGNPSGISKIPKEVVTLAKAHTVEAVEALVRCLKDYEGMVVVRAAEALLNRAWGRPAAELHVSGAIDIEELITGSGARAKLEEAELAEERPELEAEGTVT